MYYPISIDTDKQTNQLYQKISVSSNDLSKHDITVNNLSKDDPTVNDLSDIYEDQTNLISIKNYIEKLLCNPNPIDIIIASDFSLKEKLCLVENLLDCYKTYFFNLNTGISSKTISILLENKQENSEFKNLFSKIIQFWHDAYYHTNSTPIFTYDHLYHLVIQVWADLPMVLSTNFRKEIILIGLGNLVNSTRGNHIPQNIINCIKADIHDWLVNIGKNQCVTNMIDWLFQLDTSEELINTKLAYEKNMKLSVESDKAFQKQHNITKEEYVVQQEKAKKYGLCKFIREGNECKFGVKCKFYHGKLEETEGVQECFNGFNCNHIANGKCKFVHTPTKKQFTDAKDFYEELEKDDTGFLVPYSRMKSIDLHCSCDPFIILKKGGTIGEKIHYFIPKCSCVSSCDLYCNKPVRFMTKNNQVMNFYCSYEHMVKSEKNTPSYVVKQNILDQIFEVDRKCNFY